MRLSYDIKGLHCQACIQKIDIKMKELGLSANVTLEPPRAVLQADNLPALSVLNAALSQIGNYEFQEENTTESHDNNFAQEKAGWIKTYYPILLIISFISVVSFKGAQNLHEWNLHFMAGFFIIFSFFKFLDLKGFQQAYATYDILAKRWFSYGLIYPFLELALGFSFLFYFQVTAALYFSSILMIFSSIGVIQALRQKRVIACACLGTALKLPMSTLTLVEDLGMAAMSLWMLMVGF